MRGGSFVVAVSAAVVGVLGAGLVPVVAAEGTSIAASRSSVMAGERFVVSGVLPSAGPRTVALQRLDGDVWSTVARKRTDGAYSFSTSTSESARYRVARLSATPAETDAVTVRVATQRTKIATPESVTVDSPAVFAASSTPVREGRQVSLQAYLDGAWKVVTAARTDAVGRAELSWTPARAGEVKVRTVAGRFDGSSSSTSGTRTLAVRELADAEGLPKGSGAKRDGQWITLTGDLADGSVLSAEHSGYILDKARVPAGSSLTIPAGVRIKCQVARSSPPDCLEVAGRLDVTGTADAPVIFARIDDDAIGGTAPGAGEGDYSNPIYGEGAPVISVEHAVFRSATTVFALQDTRNADLRVTDTLLDGTRRYDCRCYGPGSIAAFDRVTLSKRLDFGYGSTLSLVDSQMNQASLTGSFIRGLAVTGTQFTTSSQISVHAPADSPARALVRGSSFSRESDFGSHIGAENVDLDLRANWWGTVAGPGFGSAEWIAPWCADAACRTFADADGPVE